jgi:hypothetical protein
VAIALIYVCVAGLVTLSTTLLWVFSTRVGGEVTEVSLGWPAVKLGRVRFGPVPSGSIDIAGRADSDGRWYRIPLGKRLLVVVVPWLVWVAIALACLGPERAVRSGVHGIGQLLFTFDLAPLVRRFVALAAVAPWSTIVGIIAAKAAAWNVLPVGGVTGGAVVQELATANKPAMRWLMISLVVVMVWTLVRIAWLIVQLVTG